MRSGSDRFEVSVLAKKKYGKHGVDRHDPDIISHCSSTGICIAPTFLLPGEVGVFAGSKTFNAKATIFSSKLDPRMILSTSQLKQIIAS